MYKYLYYTDCNNIFYQELISGAPSNWFLSVNTHLFHKRREPCSLLHSGFSTADGEDKALAAPAQVSMKTCHLHCAFLSMLITLLEIVTVVQLH